MVTGISSNLYKTIMSCKNDDKLINHPNSIFSQKPVIEQIPSKYTKKELEFRELEVGELKEIPDSVKTSFLNNAAYVYLKYSPFRKYAVVENKGINYSNPKLRDVDVCLAKYACKVADEMETATACYTGTKHALWAAGVIDDYGDMPKGSAYMATEYFDKYPEKFEKLNVKKEDLNNLPAGIIVVYAREGEHGHIAITNGNGQEMSDCTDNMRWLDDQDDKATFAVYRLTDNWHYDSKTKKLVFNN